MAEAIAIPDALRHPSAVVTARSGQQVVQHYGSATGELAACISGVGLALRADLAIVSAAGSARSVDLLTRRILGYDLVQGGTAIEADAWWVRDPATHDLLVICRRGAAKTLADRLRLELGRLTSTGRVSMDSHHYVLLSLFGPLTTAVLNGLGVVPAQGLSACAPFSLTAVSAHRVAWLVQASTAVLAITDNAGARSVWQAIEDAGRRHAIAYVGMDATQRYLLLERARQAAPLLL
jgi:hypothetical protein